MRVDGFNAKYRLRLLRTWFGNAVQLGRHWQTPLENKVPSEIYVTINRLSKKNVEPAASLRSLRLASVELAGQYENRVPTFSSQDEHPIENVSYA